MDSLDSISHDAALDYLKQVQTQGWGSLSDALKNVDAEARLIKLLGTWLAAWVATLEAKIEEMKKEQ